LQEISLGQHNRTSGPRQNETRFADPALDGARRNAQAMSCFAERHEIDASAIGGIAHQNLSSFRVTPCVVVRAIDRARLGARVAPLRQAPLPRPVIDDVAALVLRGH